MMTFILNCGTKVEVNRFQLGYTYSSLVEGQANEEVNKEIFEWLDYPSNWAKRKYLKQDPGKEAFQNQLPPAHYSVWLFCNRPLNEQADASDLIFTWLGETPQKRSIKEIIKEGIKELDWQKQAGDFYY